MKRMILLLIGCFATLYGQAQSNLSLTMNKDGKVIFIPKKKEYELKLPPLSYKSYTPASTREIDAKLREFMPDIVSAADERPMDMQVLSAAYQPFFDVFAPMLRRVSPMAFDFNETTVVPIDKQFSFLVTGQQYTWPGAGGLITINPSLQWQSGAWMAGAGVFGGKFYTPFNLYPELMGGVNAQVRYAATEWLALRVWGQYAYYGDQNDNPHMLLNPFYNHTSVGGAFEFKFNENVGVGFGVNYEYNPIRQKMEPQYMIYPLIKGRNIRIGW